MRAYFILAIGLLAGCATLPPGPDAYPQKVTIGGSSMRVAFSDGEVCRAEVGMEGGAGRLEGCAHPFDWQVTILRRNFLEPFLGAIVAPYGRVTLSDPASDRSWSFRTPFELPTEH